MSKQPTYLYIGILLGAASNTVLADPLNAVIGLSNSQIVENNQAISLTPNSGTLLPLQDNFAPITHLENNANANWFGQINKRIRVEHKQRDLNYSGTLAKIDERTRSFILTSKDYSTTLPMDDFYLIPLETQSSNTETEEADKDKKTNAEEASSQRVSYQTDDLSWSPQLSLIFDNDQFTVSQQAQIHNNSNTKIQIQDSLLHYSRQSSSPRFKAERSTLALSADQANINYQDNEVTYSIGSTLTIAPYSDMLIPLPSTTGKINNHTHKANAYTYNTNSGKIELNFYNNVSFALPQNGLPGEYKTFWKRGNLLVPGNTVQLDTVRAGNTVEVTTNKSQDVTGYLTLISASSQKLPSTQIWEATVINHSNTPQKYTIEQTSNGIINVLESDEAAPINANSLRISGVIPANQEKNIRYKIEVKN